MKDFLDKLSSYNIFNYLFPGIVFVVLCESFTSFSFIQSDIILGVFIYYFIGLIISRIGSLIIEPFYKWTKFIKFSDYSDFVSSSKQDDKIELLSEVNNMYRTLSSMVFVILFLKFYDKISSYLSFLTVYKSEIVILLLFVMFSFSYRKQTNYITSRIEKTKSSR